MLDLLGYREGVDSLTDVFPGSGSVTRAASIEILDLLEPSNDGSNV
jgi:hypothetical protein